ncbi:MAG: dual specificity protein phosphatase family protein [Endozoicomonadaceae bacterium]|nr:dual specificity protein phosphatase family protein [Endozoicomonadaceae bacterium]
MYNIKFVFIALLALMISITTVANEALMTEGEHRSFASSRVKFVDQIGDNLLYRGNKVIENNEFVFQRVLDAMVSENSRKTPVNNTLIAPSALPESIYFIDVNLLTMYNPKEVANFNIENNFFLQYPSVGELVHYDANAIFLKGFLLGIVGKLTDNIITNLHDLLLEKKVKLRIIYVHCEAGLDRTGIIIAGYAMRYLEYTYTEALALNVKLNLRNPNMSAQMIIQLYAKYLKDVIGISTIGNTD